MKCLAPMMACAFWSKISDITLNRTINGGIYLYPEQVARIDTLLKSYTSSKTINVCESGFGSGHFSSLILSYNFTNVISFDVFEKDYKKKIVKLIRKNFGKDRFRYFVGNTRTTIPNSIFPKCDIVHVSVPKNEYLDIVNFHKKSQKSAILTASSLNRNFNLYRLYFPVLEEKGIIDHYSCENVSSVSSKLKLYMSVQERNDQIHCWSHFL